jgi:hypothetical protein
MNTKQVLYNALKGQLDIKKQTYDSYNETTTIPACHELITNIRSFISSIAPIDDSMEMDLNNRTLRIKTSNERYSNGIEIILHTTWQGDKAGYWVDLEWNSGSYNLTGKNDKLNHINILHSLANNLESINDKFINEWRNEWSRIWDADHVIQKEYTDLQNALNTLSSEIHNDSVDAMKEIGFEIKQFKPQYGLDWDYDENDDNKRIYKIETSTKSIKVQYGRSQYENTYINGFKVLGKKGNKYSVEIFREGYPDKKYDILEKKFESFIDEVASWEYKQADKRKEEAEKNFAERTK